MKFGYINKLRPRNFYIRHDQSCWLRAFICTCDSFFFFHFCLSLTPHRWLSLVCLSPFIFNSTGVDKMNTKRWRGRESYNRKTKNFWKSTKNKEEKSISFLRLHYDCYFMSHWCTIYSQCVWVFVYVFHSNFSFFFLLFFLCVHVNACVSSKTKASLDTTRNEKETKSSESRK